MIDYCRLLVGYVKHHGPRIPEEGKAKPRVMNDDEAAAWLDEHCPAWRLGQPPAAGRIEVCEDEADEQE